MYTSSKTFLGSFSFILFPFWWGMNVPTTLFREEKRTSYLHNLACDINTCVLGTNIHIIGFWGESFKFWVKCLIHWRESRGSNMVGILAVDHDYAFQNCLKIGPWNRTSQGQSFLAIILLLLLQLPAPPQHTHQRQFPHPKLHLCLFKFEITAKTSWSYRCRVYVIPLCLAQCLIHNGK